MWIQDTKYIECFQKSSSIITVVHRLLTRTKRLVINFLFFVMAFIQKLYKLKKKVNNEAEKIHNFSQPYFPHKIV